jgi:uncharacterized repeat protein (TIGR02543 family)
MQFIYGRSAARSGWRKSVVTVVLIAALIVTSVFTAAWRQDGTDAGAAPVYADEGQVRTEVDYLGDSYNLPDNHVFENVTFERLKYVLGYRSGNGTTANNDPVYDPDDSFAVVLGGPENASSRAAIPLIDEVAKEYGVEAIYHFDPKLDGDKLDITSTDASIAAAFSDLWNNASWGLKAKLKNYDATYTSDDTYFFIYNKNRTEVNESGDAVSAPIVSGVLSKAASIGQTQATAYKGRIAQSFEDAGVDPVTNKADISVYPFFDYFKTRINTTVGTQTTYSKVWIPEEARDDFAIQTVTYPELLHILDSEGDFAIFLGGTWCPYTSPTDNIANTAAIGAGVKKVYQFDMRLDGNSSATSLKTVFKSSDADVSETVLEGSPLYGKLLEKLSNLELEPGVSEYLYYPNGDTTLPASEKRSAKSIGVPFLFEYNKDSKAADGADAPVVSEWIGYKPLKNELYAYAWYTKNNVRDYLNDPGYYEKQIGRPVDPDRDDTEGNGAVSASLALPGLYTFFNGLADNRDVSDPWAANPGSKPNDTSVPDPSGGCGSGDKVIELTVEDPILSQNGNEGYDVQHYDINATYKEGLKSVPSSLHGNIHASTVVTAKATESLSEIAFDFRQQTVTDVEVNGIDSSYTFVDDQVTDTHKIKITPAGGAVSSGSNFTVKIVYSAQTGTYRFNGESIQGLVPSVNSDGATAVGEPNGPTFWFPSNNNTTDRATYTVSLTAPRNLTGVSIGNLIERQAHGTDITRVWEQTQPTIPYLVVASFGDYIEFNQEIELIDGSKIPAWGYVDETLYNRNNSNKRKAYWFAKDLGQYINWAESRFGKYPGETAGFVFENLSDDGNSVGYSLETVGRPYYSGIPDTPTFVHEQLHQWFGDSVTIAKWEDLWLNEGFASFLSNIWFEDNDNKDETTNDWYARWFGENTDSDFWYIAPAEPINSGNLFTDVTYGRGSYALAALRVAVGDEDFFNIIKTWASEQAGKAATTADFISTAKRVSTVDGAALDALLRTWLYEQYKPSGFPSGRLPEATQGGGEGVTPTVDTGGGSSVDFGELTPGTPIGALPTPTKTGYTFGGWYVGGTRIDATFIVPVTPFTITAKWTPVTGSGNNDNKDNNGGDDNGAGTNGDGNGAGTNNGGADNNGAGTNNGVDTSAGGTNNNAGADKNYSADQQSPSIAAASITPARVTAIKDNVYTGKELKPAVSVTLDGAALSSGADYDVTYANNIKIGKATVTVTGKGDYKDTVTASFNIVPKAVSVKALKSGKNKFALNWKKTAGVTGYQLGYKLTAAGAWKNVSVSAKATGKSVGKLKKGKKYQVRIRAYKTVNGTNYYSAWSKAKTVKVK